ncbi:iron ABC transporter permease [Streptomyces shenzhenensis]|uniref:ABC transporter permease n=1 Tax=Streptomyces shenzhenensis TaxID=943815 RepID=UPI0033F43A08
MTPTTVSPLLQDRPAAPARLLRRFTSALPWHVSRIVTALAVTLAVVLPALWLARQSLQTSSGAFTLDNYVEIFTNDVYYVPLLRSLAIGVGVSALCTVLGVSMAWLVSRTDMPGRAPLRYVVYLSFIMPSLLAGVAWVMLASPNSGLLNQATDAVFGIKPLDVFTLPAMIVVMALALYPLNFIFVINSLDTQSGDVDEAAAILGAGAARRAFTVSLPLVTPAILNAALLTFLQSIALYAVPALLAIPAGQQVLTTQLFQLFGFPRRPELAAAYGVPLIVLSALVLWLRKKIMGRKSYATIGGRGLRTNVVRLGRWRWAAAVYSWAVITVAVVMPGLTLLYISLVPRWANGGFDLTLDHYRWVFSEALTSVWNTIQFSVVAAFLCVAVGFLVAYLTVRRNSFFDRVLEFFTTAPVVLPGIIIAIGIFAAYSRPPVVLYGTGVIVVLALWGRFMPTALQNIQPAIRSIHPDLENAARSVGAGMLRTVFRITMPLSSGVLISAWIFSFVLSTHEVSAAILLVSVDTDVIATQVINLYEQARFEQISALGLVLVLATMIAVAVGTALGGRRVLNRGKEF